MAKPTFTPRSHKGELLDPIEYTPLIYIVGTETHRLALHREINRLPDPHKEWVVSDPQLGMLITKVRMRSQGVPVSSRGCSIKDARNGAMSTLDTMVECIGSDKFNNRLLSARKALTAEASA